MHHEAQIAEHELPCGIEIVILAQTGCKGALLVDAEHRQGIDLLDVVIDAA